MATKTGIYQKIHEIQKEVTHMAKEGRNTAQSYNFLAEAQITALFKELLEKHKVIFHYQSRIEHTTVTPSGKQTLTNVSVSYAFIDTESDTRLEGVAAGQGTDTGDKGVYKAITGAIKYIFMKTFLIPTGDDPENDSREEKREYNKKERRDYGTSMGDPTDKPPFGPGADED